MKKTWDEEAWEDYIYWQEHDRKIVKKINSLIKDIERHPFTGLGKPEPLKNNLQGYWSRRINDKDRLVYKVSDNDMMIAQCKTHYEDR